VNAALPSSVHLIERSDYWRAPALIPDPDESIPGYKEWQHFVIFGQGWVLVFNLNIDGLPHPTGRHPQYSHPARAVTIFSAAQWTGQVDRCGDTELRLGSLDARFGDAGMRWRSGCYEIWQHQAGIQLEISLQPVAIPSLTHNIRLAERSHLSWCLVPRLLASGWVDVDGERHEFDERGAYHDHNWGRFDWGGDFSWDWGCAVPEDPLEDWTLVFARMNSADRHRTTATSAFLLERGQHIRYFRNAEVSFTSGEGSHDPPAGRIPPAAAVLLASAGRCDQAIQTSANGFKKPCTHQLGCCS
jgi:hypothetical protein